MTLSAFDHADEGPIQIGKLGELFLRKSPSSADFPHDFSESG